MKARIVDSADGVTLVGGAPFGHRMLNVALARAPFLVAADGGADRALALGRMPEAVIGDFDSLSAHARTVIPAGRQHVIAEQETTDFDKALRSVASPFVLALGFAGARIDHGLAVFNALVRHSDRPCIILGAQDIVFACPPFVMLRLRVGDRLSLFPMAPVTGESLGLRWPIQGLSFAPDGMIGTSNEVSDPEVSLRFDRPGMLAILPRARLDAALSALVPQWRPQRGVRAQPSVREG